MKNKSFLKFLALILRHNPGIIGLTLDSEGWADVDELISKANASPGKKKDVTRELIEEAVRVDDKQRYALSEDKKRIRASQGHSLEGVGIRFEEKVPPPVLFHGTSQEVVEAIRQQGVRKMERHYVHLSSAYEIAVKVGRRHGSPVVLRINTEDMAKDGHKFFLSDNGVWLAYHIPPQYIDLAI